MASPERSLWKHLVGGCGAGVATTVILHPIELVKVRLQAQDTKAGKSGPAARGGKPSTSSSSSSALPRYRGTQDALRSIVRVEGWRGLYAGLAPSVLGSGVAWGLYFMAYNAFKGQFRSEPGVGIGSSSSGPVRHVPLSPLQNLVCAAEAGAMVTLMTNPIWVLKTRLQLQLGGGMKASGAAGVAADRYAGMTSAVRSIWRKEGFAGFYRGVWPSLLLVMQGSVQLMAYEALTAASRDLAAGGAAANSQAPLELSTLQVGAIGACSKLFATFFTYPMQVVRTRLQKRQDGGTAGAPRPTTAGTMRGILRKEGFAGFYKGMVPNLMRTMPQSAITFAVYEKILRLVADL
mmetsp:Transcript_9558/g.32991  ORF Transcript_9558/g.32991 Transcript_9558/m.32991 type:complete len:348 (+) Transcript_9558:302-1345(+)